MAIAWTAVINKVTVFGDQRVVYATLTSPASCTYTTGGDSILPSLIGLDVIDYVDCNVAVNSGQTTAYVANITPGAGSGVAGKLQLFTTTAATAPLAELGSASTAAESYTVFIQAFGV